MIRKKIAVAIFRQQEESIANTILISRLGLGAAATGGVVSRATCTAPFCKYHFVLRHLFIFGDYNLNPTSPLLTMAILILDVQELKY